MNDWPPDAPNPKLTTWRMFTSTTAEEVAAAQFQNRYGEPPEWVIEWRGWLYVGPIPEARYTELDPVP